MKMDPCFRRDDGEPEEAPREAPAILLPPSAQTGDSAEMTAMLNRMLRRIAPDHRQVFRDFVGALERLISREAGQG
ncbi:hypothetical protein K32_14370 [Kaistia sp. 32K]|nr:hypothetical protein K32_14370 [Kaistia sp. 32K]